MSSRTYVKRKFEVTVVDDTPGRGEEINDNDVVKQLDSLLQRVNISGHTMSTSDLVDIDSETSTFNE